MVSLPGRSGRRRRVLNEEVLSASSSHVALRASADKLAVSASRYGEEASFENHPQITDFIPRRLRTIAVLVLGGMLLSTLAVAAQQFAEQFVVQLIGQTAEPLNVSAQVGIASWISAVLLLVTGMICAIVHSIRRHRIDDVRGRYRVWRWASLFCLIASANCVAGFHTLAAEGLSLLAGWTALRGGAVWWLAIAGIPLAWVTLKAFFDVKESPLVAVLMVLAIAVYSVAFASYLGYMPKVESNWEPLVTCAATMVGHWLLFSTVFAYARHVVLDAQGLIAVKAKAASAETNRRSRDAEEPSLTKSSADSPKAESTRVAPALVVHNPSPTRDKSPTIVPAKSQANLKDWVDGRRREKERYESDNEEDGEDEMSGDDRKMSKAERKQLRKLKARNRAA